jgi:hypothetical protein
MLGLGWLAQQAGNLGNKIRGGIQRGIGMSPDGNLGQFKSPDFNPNAAGALPMMREQGGGASNLLTTSVNPGDIPTSAPYRPTFGKPLAPVSSYGAERIAPPVYHREVAGEESMPVPSIAGIPGGQTPYDPIAKKRFEYIYGRQPKQQVEHTASDGSTFTVDEPRQWTRGERLKAGFMPMLAGVARGAAATPQNPLAGAIGGAASGFGLGVASPNLGSLESFSTFVQPRLEADAKRNDEEFYGGLNRQKAQIGLEGDRANVDYTRARTDATRAGMKDSATEMAYRRSQAGLNDARAQALTTGKPQIRDVVDENGQIRTYQVFPDQSMVELGGSAKAAIADQGNATKKEIAAGRNQTAIQTTQMRQDGAAGRTAATQAGQDRRLQARQSGASGSSGVSTGGGGSKKESFIQKAVAAGYSRQEAETEAKRRGLQ